MTGTSRIGVLLLLLLAAWVVMYYLLFSPIASDKGEPGDGLNILDTDSVGSNPDEAPPVIEEAPPQSQAEVKPPPRQPEEKPEDPPASNAGGSVGSEAQNGTIPAPPTTTPYTVKHRDTMESIAADWFGTKSKWVLIANENPLVDPLKLKTGQNLRLPPKDAKLDSISIEELRRLGRGTKYVVADGDSLWKIAAKFYGNGSLHYLISDANHDVLGSSNDLQIGMELILPPYQKPAD